MLSTLHSPSTTAAAATVRDLPVQPYDFIAQEFSEAHVFTQNQLRPTEASSDFGQRGSPSSQAGYSWYRLECCWISGNIYSQDETQLFCPVSAIMAQNDGRSPLSDLTAEESQQVLAALVLTCNSALEREELFVGPIGYAVRDGHNVLVESLLKLGASANTKYTDGDSLLHMAAAAGNHNAVRALLRHGAAVHALDRNKHTALHLAAMNNNHRTAGALLRWGARADYRPDKYEGVTALDVAATSGSVAVINICRVHGAELRTGNLDGYTALHAAASEDQAGAITSLVRGGVNVDTLDRWCSTPLHVAMKKNSTKAVRALLALGADINKFHSKHQTETPLHSGIKAPGSLSAVNALLDAGADANLRQRGHDDHSPLDMAAWMGKVDIVRALLEHGADSTAMDSEDQSALHKASSCNQAGAVDALIEAGALVNARDRIGFTPLHYAAYVLAAEAGNALLAHGAHVNAEDESNQTPLHLAARMSEKNDAARFVELLLNSDADEAPVDAGGRTPGDLLVFQEQDENGPPQGPRDNALVVDQLSRAPAERRWRRQSVFVMHRARLKKARANLTDSDAAPRRAKAARVEGNGAAGNSGDQGVVAHPGAAEGASMAENDAECVLTRFMGVAEDGVFRNVVKFL